MLTAILLLVSSAINVVSISKIARIQWQYSLFLYCNASIILIFGFSLFNQAAFGASLPLFAEVIVAVNFLVRIRNWNFSELKLRTQISQIFRENLSLFN